MEEKEEKSYKKVERDVHNSYISDAGFKGTGMSCPVCGDILFAHPDLGIANKVCSNPDCTWGFFARWDELSPLLRKPKN